MATVSNPAQLLVRMKKVVRKDMSYYYIGNCNLEVNLLDTVLCLYPPKGETNTLEQAAASLLKWADSLDGDEDKQLNNILKAFRSALDNNDKDRTAQLSIKTVREVPNRNNSDEHDDGFQDE